MNSLKLKFLLLFFALAVAIPSAWAQERLLVCEGTTTNYYVPIAYAGAYGSSYPSHQMIYPAELLAEMEGGKIKGLTFYTQQDIVCNQGSFNVLIGETTQTSFSSATAITGLTTVVTNRAPQAGGTEFVVNFDNDYEYQGGNLVIEFYINENLYNRYASMPFYGQTQTTNTSFGYASMQKFLPKLTFTYEPGTLPDYKVKVTPDVIDFGKTTPNAPKTQNVTVTNKGANPITPTVTGLSAPFSTTYTPTEIAYNETATIPIVYNPTTTGDFDCLFEVGDAGGNIEPVEIIVSGSCANEITVADGDLQYDDLPIYGYYYDELQVNQMIYPQTMLQSLIGKNIKSMTFYSTGMRFYGGKYTVSIGTTNVASFSSKARITEGLTPVAVDLVAPGQNATELTIQFNEPFTYNGGNLLVDFEETVEGEYGGGRSNFICSEAESASFFSYGSSKDENGVYSGGSVRNYLPKVTFGFEDGGETPVVTVAEPVFDPVDGTTFEENLTVSLSCETQGATIQYSYNGEYFTDYDAPIVINETTTIYAKAVLGTAESQVVNATYTKQAAPQPSTNEYVLVTDVADLAAGKHIIFVNKEKAKAMSSTQNNNNRGATAITISADIATATEATEIFTLEQEQVEDVYYWLFKASKTPGYIYAAGANSNNYLRTEETAISKAQATVTIAGDGIATVAFNAGERNIMKYNSSNDIFSCYASTSTQSPVYIFIEKSGDTPQPTQVATPTFNPAQGEYNEAQNVTITCGTQGATIYYTVDGTDPTAESAVYSEPINVAQTTTIKAIAMKADMTDSEIAIATYTINIPEPGEDNIYVKLTTDALTPGKKYIFVYEGDEQAMAMGAYNNKKCDPVNVTINNGEVNIAGLDDIIEFTAGEGPDVTGTDTKQYTLAFDGVYLAYASGTDFKQLSEIGVYDTEAYWRIKTHEKGYTVYNGSNTGRSIQKHATTNKFGPYADGQDLVSIYVQKEADTPEPEQVATPTFDPEQGEFTAAQKVAINCATEGATIYYTVDGTEPTAESAVYSDSINVDKTMTIKAIAMKEGWTNSEVAEATYTINYPAITVALNPAEGTYTVGDEANVIVTVQNTVGTATVTYSINGGEAQNYDAQAGIVLPTDVAGEITLSVSASDDYHAEAATATGSYTVYEALTIALNPAEGTYYVGDEAVVIVAVQHAVGDVLVSYKINDGEEQDYDDQTGIVLTSTEEATMTVKAFALDDRGDIVETSGTYSFVLRPVVATPTFSLFAGSYTGNQTLTINCETEGAVISYSTDGGNTWTVGNTVTLTEDCTVMAKATMDGMTESPVATAAFIIDQPTELPDVTPIEGYFQVKNNGNEKYVNIAGRKTLNFTSTPDAMAGTVIYVKTNGKGQVQSLRSQAADLQGYANRAMRYVPDMVRLVAQKLKAEGPGEILGENGLDEIMDKFDECFDYHLYVEEADGGYRLYGKTPSMQHVVDFYREHTEQVEAKLPNLESFINSALQKLRDKIGGSTIFTDFSLHQIWENMETTLTEPTDPASTMTFYREVLNNKNYVWDFAYQTALIYLNNLTDHPRWHEIEDMLGEYAQYIDKLDQVRPDFKYYIVQDNDKPDYISEGNKEISENAARTIWTLEPRTEFKVTFTENTNACNKYKNVTTLYTDFAYSVPEGVTAYKVVSVNENGNAKIEAINDIIPAQTPVLLMATEAGEKVLTISTQDGAELTDNLLVGPDYLIKTYEIKTPQVADLFEMAEDVFGEEFYNSYIKEYEYLMLKTAGTVNNKYFWGLTDKDLELCNYVNENNEVDCVVRSLDTEGSMTGFVKNYLPPRANQAFMVSEEFDTIKLSVRGDVNHDGVISIKDVTTLIAHLLGADDTACPYCSDVNENGELTIGDVTALIAYLLNEAGVTPPVDD